MVSYTYRAQDQNGVALTGEIEAENATEAARLLTGRGWFVGELKPRVASMQAGKCLGEKKRAIFFRELSFLIGGGLAPGEALRVLAMGGAKKNPASVLHALLTDGHTLAGAMAKAAYFPAVEVGVVRAGEMGGRLEEALARLAEYAERDYKAKERYKTAMAYPLFLLGTAMASTVFLAVIVLPNFSQMFAGLSIELPLSTRILLGVGDFLLHHSLAVLLTTIALLSASLIFFQSQRGKNIMSTLLLRMPFLGRLALFGAWTRAFDVLAMLLASGVVLEAALDCAREVTRGAVAEVLSRAALAVRRGDSLAKALQGRGAPPLFFRELLAAGETTGALDEAFQRAADFCRFEGEMLEKRMASLAEPLAIAFLGLLAGGIVFSVALPMLDALESMG